MDAWSGDVPLPYFYAYQYLPFFSKAYRPYRIGVIALTCLAAMGAVGAAAVRAELGRRWVAIGAAALTVLAVSQPLWSGDRPATRPMADARIPALYGALSELPEGAVVEATLLQPTTVANARYQYQTRHKHPLLNCNQLIRRTIARFRRYGGSNSSWLTSRIWDAPGRLPLHRRRPAGPGTTASAIWSSEGAWR